MSTNTSMCTVQPDATKGEETTSESVSQAAAAVGEGDDPVIFLSGPGVLHMHSYDLVRTSQFREQIRALKALKNKGLLEER